jgi:hypothetical protein
MFTLEVQAFGTLSDVTDMLFWNCKTGLAISISNFTHISENLVLIGASNITMWVWRISALHIVVAEVLPSVLTL